MATWIAQNSVTLQLSGSPVVVKEGDIIDDATVDVSVLRAAGVQLAENTGGAATRQAFAQAQALRGQQKDQRNMPAEAPYLRLGQATVANTGTTAVWTFSGAEADTSYFVSATPTAVSSSANAGASRVRKIAKNAGNVVITVEDAPSAGQNVTFDIFLARS